MTRRLALGALVFTFALALGRVAAAAADLVDFARCISRAGATFYTASWCPHCARQSRMFGDAIRYVHSVDCTNGCSGVGSFPTWTFADGSRISGVAPLDVLASRTRCRLGQSRGETPEDADGSPAAGTRERYVGGMKIIEVPR
jgi:hypothetical protein